MTSRRRANPWAKTFERSLRRITRQTTRVGDTVTLVRGPQTITFGGEYRRMQINTRTDQNARGSFTFRMSFDTGALPLSTICMVDGCGAACGTCARAPPVAVSAMAATTSVVRCEIIMASPPSAS